MVKRRPEAREVISNWARYQSSELAFVGEPDDDDEDEESVELVDVFDSDFESVPFDVDSFDDSDEPVEAVEDPDDDEADDERASFL